MTKWQDTTLISPIYLCRLEYDILRHRVLGDIVTVSKYFFSSHLSGFISFSSHIIRGVIGVVEEQAYSTIAGKTYA